MKHKKVDEPVIYGIWVEATAEGPMKGQHGYLSSGGIQRSYFDIEDVKRRVLDLENQCVCKKPVVHFQWKQYSGIRRCKATVSLEEINQYHLVPEFDPTGFQMKSQAFGNTGGGCMVGAVSFYLPDLDKTVWVNCNDEGVTITSADYVWNDDYSESWKQYEDVLLFDMDYRGHRPEELGAWLPMVREALAYTIEQQTEQYGRRFILPAIWLPDTYRERINVKDLALLMEQNAEVVITGNGRVEVDERILGNGQKQVENKRLIYVASPYAGDTEGNTEYAKQACRTVMEQGHAFFAPHLLYTAVLNDSVPEERQAGMEMGKMMLAKCDELWVFGNRISTGMAAEISEAERLGIPIQYVEIEIKQDCSDGPTMEVPC